MDKCNAELCINWTGSGCICDVMGLDKADARREEATAEPEPEWVCYKHDDCESADDCSEQSYADWKASHDTTSCGGMQNGCSACAHTW
jgi:hypothetical protein